MPILLLILNAATALLLGLLFAFLPRYSQPGLALGLTVHPAFLASSACASILRRYTRQMLGVTFLMLVLLPAAFLAWPTPLGITMISLAGPLVLFGAFVVLLARARHALMPHRTVAPPRHAPPRQPVRYHAPASLGWLNALPYLLVLAPLLWVWLHWDTVPAEIPRYLDLGDASLRVARKSLANAFGVPVIILGGIVLGHSLQLLARATHSNAGQTSPFGANALILLEAMVALGALGGYLALVSLYGAWLITSSPGIAILVVLMLAALALPAVTILTLQHRRNLEPMEIGDRSDDRFWWLGLLYHNAADPALFVEKRLGIGYTVNLGRPAGKLLIAGVLSLVALALAAPFLLA